MLSTWGAGCTEENKGVCLGVFFFGGGVWFGGFVCLFVLLFWLVGWLVGCSLFLSNIVVLCSFIFSGRSLDLLYFFKKRRRLEGSCNVFGWFSVVGDGDVFPRHNLANASHSSQYLGCHLHLVLCFGDWRLAEQRSHFSASDIEAQLVCQSTSNPRH